MFIAATKQRRQKGSDTSSWEDVPANYHTVWPQGNSIVLHGQDFQGMQQMLKEPSVESKWTAEDQNMLVTEAKSQLRPWAHHR